MNDLVWKIERRDWQAVAEQIKKEERIKIVFFSHLPKQRR